MDDVDEELTRLSIRSALERHGYYFEATDRNDDARVGQLARLGRAIADELGADVSMARARRRDGGIQIGLALIRSPLEPEPAA